MWDRMQVGGQEGGKGGFRQIRRRVRQEGGLWLGKGYREFMGGPIELQEK